MCCSKGMDYKHDKYFLCSKLAPIFRVICPLHVKATGIDSIKISEHNIGHINKLHPAIRKQVTELLLSVQKLGIRADIKASIRTIEEQDVEYRKGRDENGNDIEGKVRTTWVKGGYSYHNYGLAVDFEIFNTDGKKNWDFSGYGWQTLITNAERIGFTSGYRWAFPKNDPPHIENSLGLTTIQLKALYENGKVKNGYVIIPKVKSNNSIS